MAELTVGQRIILHLSRFTGLISEFEVPADMTQEGTARACGISRSHAAVEIKRLKEKGLLTEELRHIKGGRTRRKVYFLTEEGMREKLAILRFAEENAIVMDTSPPHSDGADDGIFIGRERELSALKEWADSATRTVLNIHGPPGVGKNTLLRRFGEVEGIPVFIHEIRGTDSFRAVILHLADFLAAKKAPRLRKSLERGYDTGEVAYILSNDIGRLIIAIEGNRQDILSPLFSLLNGLPPGIKLAVITEKPLEDRPDPAADCSMEAISVPPFTRDEVAMFLEARGDDSDADSMLAETGGVPLFLEALLAERRGGSISDVVEGVVEGLTGEKRAAMLTLAVALGDIPAEAFADRLPLVSRKGGFVRLHPVLRERLLGAASDREIREAHVRAAGLTTSAVDRLRHFLIAGELEKASSVLRREMESITENHLHLLEGYLRREDATTPELRLLTADYLLWTGDRKGALDMCREALSGAEPGSLMEARILLRLGRIHSQDMATDTATDHIKRAVEISRKKMYIREEAAARREWASLLIRRREYAEARRHLDIALDLALMARDEPLISKIMADRAGIKLAAEDVDGAFSDYTSSLIVTGDSPTPGRTYRLAICHQRAELFEALGDMNRLSAAYMDCARIYREMDNRERASYYARRALNIARNSGLPSVVRRAEDTMRRIGLS